MHCGRPIFAGVDGYISPSLYATKAETDKTVPTWNYETINVYGTLHAHNDRAWPMNQVSALTDRHEEQRAQPWSVTDAPQSYIDTQLNGIVGIEMRITQWGRQSENVPESTRPESEQRCREVNALSKSRPSSPR